MTLPVSGAISINAINVELGVAGTTTASLNQSSFRTLAGVPSGAISMSNFYGKSNRKAISITIASNTTNYVLNTAKASGYIAGGSDVTLTINSGVVVYSTSTGSYALTVDTSWAAGDTVTIINNGTILGKGGAGGGGFWTNGKDGIASQTGFAAGPGLLVQRSTSINNVNRISGGGGGGGGGGGAPPYEDQYGQGGGGGIGEGAAGAPGGSRFNPPQISQTKTAATAGTLTAAGTGGIAFDGKNAPVGGPGGNGGTYGSAGAAGLGNGASGGGAAGAAVAGNSNITWIATGTRNGAIT